MQFPLQIAFKILTFVPQMYVREGSGRSIGYVRSKLLAFKEDVTVFEDESQARPIYTIKADRIIDFTANYQFADGAGRPLGRVRREGVRSLWRAHYVISVGERATFEVSEASVITRLIDSVVGEIPLVGAFTGLFFNPIYNVTRIGGGPEVLRMTKKPALLETDFSIEQLGSVSPDEQACALLGLMMIILLERSRG